jgi:hypothetical protein
MLSHAAATAARQALAPGQAEQQAAHTAVSQESQEPESGQAQVDAAEQTMTPLPDMAATPHESTAPDQPDSAPLATIPVDITPADTALADSALADITLVDTALPDTALVDTTLVDTMSGPTEPEPVQIASAAEPDSATDTAPHRSADHPGAGISDPPGISQPASPPVVPSWMPPGQAERYGPYAPDHSPEHNGIGAQPALAEPIDQVQANTHQVQADTHQAQAATYQAQADTHQAQADTHQARADTHQAQANTHQVQANTHQVQADTEQVQTATAAPTRRRRATKRRLPTQKIFSELATQAAIPAEAYAIGEEVDGAMCLVRTDEGFEVFNSSGGARHEVRIFQDEESAYFYLFGVLVAESVRTGALIPRD